MFKLISAFVRRVLKSPVAKEDTSTWEDDILNDIEAVVGPDGEIYPKEFFPALIAKR